MSEIPEIPGWEAKVGKKMTLEEFAMMQGFEWDDVRSNPIFLNDLQNQLPNTPTVIYKAKINNTKFKVRFEGALDPKNPYYTPQKIKTIMEHIDKLANFAPLPSETWRNLLPDDPKALERKFSISVCDVPNTPPEALAWNVEGYGVMHIQASALRNFDQTTKDSQESLIDNRPMAILSPMQGLARRWYPASAIAANPPSWEYVLTHEWGHALDNLTDQQADEYHKTCRGISGYSDFDGSGFNTSNANRETDAEAFADCWYGRGQATDSSKTIYRGMKLPESHLEKDPTP
jgi:hypothetical protein